MVVGSMCILSKINSTLTKVFRCLLSKYLVTHITLPSIALARVHVGSVVTCGVQRITIEKNLLKEGNAKNDPSTRGGL